MNKKKWYVLGRNKTLVKRLRRYLRQLKKQQQVIRYTIQKLSNGN
jgi:hypothetical protein